MDTRIDEIASGIYRLSTLVPVVPGGLNFNQFLVMGDEPLLFHTGLRKLFPQVSAAVAKVMPLARLRWISFGHYEADECGAMNEWLAAAPRAEVAHGMIGCMVSLNDMADRPPRVLADGETIDLGGKRVRYIDTPHLPHGWDAGLLYEETTRTLLCGDLFTHFGDTPPLTSGDIVGPAFAAGYDSLSLGPTTAPTIRKLAQLAPTTLALMHGASFRGDTAAALHALANGYEARLQDALRTRAAA